MGDWLLNVCFVARVIHKSNDKSAHSVLVVNLYFLTNFKGGKINMLFTGLGRTISIKTLPSVLNTLGKVFLDMALLTGK